MAACAPGVTSPEMPRSGGASGSASGGASAASGGRGGSGGGAAFPATGGSVATGGGTASGGGGVATGGSMTGSGGTASGSMGGKTAMGAGASTSTGGRTAATGGRGGGSGGGSVATGGRGATGGAAGGAAGGQIADGGGISPTDAGAGTGGAGTVDGGATTVWRPFADTSPWNTVIGANPAVDPNSATLINDLVHGVPGQDFLWLNLADFSVPVYYVDANTPIRTVTTDLAGEGFDGKVPIPAGAAPDPESDHHFCVVDRTKHQTWSMWNASISSTAAHCSVGARIDLLGSGVHPMADVANPWQAAHDARACGFPLIAGLIRVDEIRAGRIAHALVMAYPHIRSRYYVPPASTAQAATDAAGAQPNRGIPCGGRVQLDPSIDVTKLGLTASAVVIARALQEYGAYIGDYSGSISIYAENAPDARAQWNAGLLGSNDVGTLDMTRLRVLTIGTLHDNGN